MTPLRSEHPGRNMNLRHAALLTFLLLFLGGCTSLWTNQAALPEQFTTARLPLVVHSDFPVAADDLLLSELAAQQGDVARRLGLPQSQEKVNVYLFNSADTFRKFIRQRHPEFPDRRAFFDESDGQLAVYAQRGPRLAEDLRHETTHAYLHGVTANLPLWLDEGLAKYFEIPSGQRGWNTQYAKQIEDAMRQGKWHPDLRRLERLDPASDMSQADYVESWAWVHFLLESGPSQAELLRQYLSTLRSRGRAEPLSRRLSEEALNEHLRHGGA